MECDKFDADCGEREKGEYLHSREILITNSNKFDDSFLNWLSVDFILLREMYYTRARYF